MEKIKLLLGFSSGKLNKYLYFNFSSLPNSIVITNGDYELLTTYPVTLSIHLLKFKDPSEYEELAKFFKVPPNIPYVIRVELLLKALISSLVDDISIRCDSNYTSKIYTKDNTPVVFSINEEDTTDSSITTNSADTSDEDIDTLEELEEIFIDSFPKDDILGAVVNNIYAWKILEEDAYLLDSYSEEYFQSTRYIKTELTVDTEWYNSKCYRSVKLDKEFFNYDVDIEDTYFLFIDGQDAVSIKGFIKRLKNIGKCYQYIWRDYNGKSAKSIAVYEDNSVVIKTTRPYYSIVPVIRRSHSH